MIYLTLFAVTFGNVAVRAFQQINVTHGHYKRIPATSYLFAAFDFLVITSMVRVDPSLLPGLLAVLAMGTGGWMGCFASMRLTGYLNGKETT